MDLSGQYRIPAAPGRVWQALNDEHVLRVSIPGCESLERVGATEWQARVVVRIGALKASFSGRVTLSDLDPPHGYTIAGRGEGGAAGVARGSARVRLDGDDGGGTLLRYDAKAEVGGKLASLGGRLIQGFAAKSADDFFTRLSAAVSNGDAAMAPNPQTPPPPPVEHRGPAEAEIGKIKPVPTHPAIPYTIGQTPRQQRRIIIIGAVLWLCVAVLVLKGYLF